MRKLSYDVRVVTENNYFGNKTNTMWYLNIPYLSDAESLARGASTAAGIVDAVIFTAGLTSTGMCEACTYQRGKISHRSPGWSAHKKEVRNG